MGDLTERGLVALDFSKGLIARREHSVFELRRKLFLKGLAGEADAVVACLSRSGLLDDERFAHAWVSARIFRKGEGRRRLVAELIKRGVSHSIAEMVVNEQLTQEQEYTLLKEHAAALVACGCRPEVMRRRLLTRGFSPSQVNRFGRSIEDPERTVAE